MAAINAVITQPQRGMVVATWTAVTENDTFSPVELGAYPDKSIHIKGTFGSSTIVVKGSNDNASFIGLNDPQGTAISVTAEALEQILENSVYLQPVASGGTSASITIILIGFSRG